MSALSAARLLATGATWRATGTRAAGRALVRGAATGGTDDRVLAGILLTRAGDRSVPLIRDALATADVPTVLVDVLASIGTPAARAALDDAARAERADLATAARRALDALDQQRDLGH